MDLRASFREVQKLDYNNLTDEQIEEFVEFLDWSRVPSRFITNDVKKYFGSFPELNLRIWFEDILSKLQPLSGYEEFISGVCYQDILTKNFLAEFNFIKNKIYFCNKNVLSKINENHKSNYTSNTVEKYIRSVWKEHHYQTGKKLISVDTVNTNWESIHERDGRIMAILCEELFYLCFKLKLCIL